MQPLLLLSVKRSMSTYHIYLDKMLLSTKSFHLASMPARSQINIAYVILNHAQSAMSQPQSSSIDHQTQSSSNDRQPLKEIQNTYQTQHQQPPVNGFSTRFLPWDIC